MVAKAMSEHPPFRLTRASLHWLYFMIDTFNDGDALSLLAWQASIGPGGINEGAP